MRRVAPWRWRTEQHLRYTPDTWVPLLFWGGLYTPNRPEPPHSPSAPKKPTNKPRPTPKILYFPTKRHRRGRPRPSPLARRAPPNLPTPRLGPSSSPKGCGVTREGLHQLLGLEEALEVPHLPDAGEDEDDGLGDGPPEHPLVGALARHAETFLSVLPANVK